MKKNNISFFILLLMIPHLSFAIAKYPYVSDFSGSTLSLQKDGKSERLRRKMVFQKYALISTGDKSIAKIEIDKETSIIIGANSSVEFPAIAYDEGEVSDVWLKNGVMRVQANQNQHYYSTQVTHLKIANTDFVYAYDPVEIKTRIFVISGSLNFSGTDCEEIVRVGPHEKSIFSGVIEDGNATFDILIGGKKVAKGKLGLVEKIPPTELASLEKELSFKIDKPIKKIVKVVRSADQICDKPFGKMNECSWSCDQWDVKKKTCLNDCIRRRCNANGEWADDFVDKSESKKCSKIPIVETCDY